MSYEICVLAPAYAADRAAANAAWNDQKYWDTSLPDQDRSAAKWRTKDLLLSFDNRLSWKEPEPPKTGFFARLLGKPPQVQRFLSVFLNHGDDAETSFTIFDEAIEIELPWDASNEEAEIHVRALWRYLEQLFAAGWTIYDTERDVLLDLETDFESVVARYLKNLGPDDDTDAAVAQDANTASSRPASATQKTDKPFTGNVD